MRIKTHLDNTLYLSSLWSDLSCAAELVITGAPAGSLKPVTWNLFTEEMEEIIKISLQKEEI